MVKPLGEPREAPPLTPTQHLMLGLEHIEQAINELDDASKLTLWATVNAAVAKCAHAVRRHAKSAKAGPLNK